MRLGFAFAFALCSAAVLTAQARIGGPFPVKLIQPTRASVWIVDAEGGGDFTELQPAIDAARSGDVILLRSDLINLEEGLLIEGKGLTIVGEGDERRSIQLLFFGLAQQVNLDIDAQPDPSLLARVAPGENGSTRPASPARASS